MLELRKDETLQNQCRLPPNNQEAKDKGNVISILEGNDVLICSLESKEESEGVIL